MDITKIYLVENCYGDSNKVYIGKTKSCRKTNHKKTYGSTIIYSEIDEIKSINKQDWEPLETFWIQYFKFLGFDVQNIRMKGGSGPSYQSIEVRNKISLSHMGKILSNETREKISKSQLGKKITTETRNNISIARFKKGTKPILQYDLEGNFIKEWESTADATYFYIGSRKGELFNSLNTNKSRFGFLWRYKTYNYPLKIDRYKRKTGYITKPSIPIYQLNINGDVIKEWESIKCASLELKINKKDINACCRFKLKTAGKFKWEYKLN